MTSRHSATDGPGPAGATPVSRWRPEPVVPRPLVPLHLRLTGTNRRYVTAEGARRHLRERTLRPRPYGPPRRLRADVTVSVERWRSWPVYTLGPAAGGARGAVVYVHGGAWVNEIVAPHWRLAARIAAEAGTHVVVPVHPLLPFATVADVVPAMVGLFLTVRERHGATALAGDSAGGQIALSTAVLLRETHRTVARRTVLVSPALDLSFTHPGIDAVQPYDPWLARPGLRVFADHWRGGLPTSDPMVSPLAADPRGLGPVTLFSGTHDILHPDARLFADRARAAGVDVELHEARGAVHVYPLTPTRDGARARSVVVDRLRAPSGGRDPSD
ncbi:alpha/beta hydrolase fold domain-containing protein [Streptomyces sp. enrichment culture]|uniref:alpha/beta hydrolase fold domain-containing protein n=1 Tax=Streptomyces sp. enrichment culture TaxID=1795815 RepID=UPI003F578DA8